MGEDTFYWKKFDAIQSAWRTWCDSHSVSASTSEAQRAMWAPLKLVEKNYLF